MRWTKHTHTSYCTMANMSWVRVWAKVLRHRLSQAWRMVNKKTAHVGIGSFFFDVFDWCSIFFFWIHTNLWRSNRLFATEGEKKINQIHIDDSITHCYVIKYSIVNYLLIRIFLLLLLQMSHLYSMFAKDVSKYCKSNSDAAAKCKRDMLSFGVTKLEKMSESHLDAMDPFQRSASDISKCLFPFNFIIYWGFQLNMQHACVACFGHSERTGVTSESSVPKGRDSHNHNRRNAMHIYCGLDNNPSALTAVQLACCCCWPAHHIYVWSALCACRWCQPAAAIISLQLS